MKIENKGIKVKKRHTVLILILALLFLSSGIFVLIRTGIFGEIRAGNDSETDSDVLINIPPKDDFDMVYFEPDPDDPFAYIAEFENFTATYYVYNTYNVNSYSFYSVMKFGEKFRIENESEITIYDGKTLYSKSSLYETRFQINDYSLFAELGLISLDELKSLVAENRASIELENDGMYVDVTYIHDNDQAEQYTLSAEYGLIISSKNQNGKELGFNNISVITENDISTDSFTIPD